MELYRLHTVATAKEESLLSIREEVKAGVLAAQNSNLPQIRRSLEAAVAAINEQSELQTEQDVCQKMRDEYLSILRSYENNYQKLRRDIIRSRLPSLEHTVVTAALLKSRKSFVKTLTTNMNEF